jgi:MFS transporter, DHA1 family, inner membrane transport protein
MFTHIVDFMIVMPLGQHLMEVLKINAQQFSLLVASYSVTAGVAGFVGAFFIDRFDRRAALIFIYAGFTLGTLACAFAPSYGFLLLTRSLAGAFGGVLGALILSIVSDAVPLERRAKGIGFVMASFGVASVLGVPIGLFVANKVSWNTPFLFLGGLGILILIIMFYSIPSMRKHMEVFQSVRPREVVAKIFTSPNTQLGLTFTSLLMLGHFTIIPFVATYMVGNVGFTKDQLTYIYLVGGLCTIVCSPIIGMLADRFGRLKIFTIFGTLVIIPIVAITNLTPVPLWIALVIAGIFFIFSNGRMVPSTTMETAVIQPEMRGSYMSIRSSVQQLTSGLASFMAGMILSEVPSRFGGESVALINYQYVGVIAVFFSVIALIVARKLTVAQGA